VIEILAGTLIDPHEVARADRFSDEVYGNDLRRVKNFSTSQSRHDSLTVTSEGKLHPAASWQNWRTFFELPFLFLLFD